MSTEGKFRPTTSLPGGRGSWSGSLGPAPSVSPLLLRRLSPASLRGASHVPDTLPASSCLPSSAHVYCVHRHTCKESPLWPGPHPGRPRACHDVSMLLGWVHMAFTAVMAADHGPQDVEDLFWAVPRTAGWMAMREPPGRRQRWEPGGGGVTYGVPTVCLWLPAHSCYLG